MALSEQQRSLAEGKAAGLTDQEACAKAGYKAKSPQAACNQVARMMKNDEFFGLIEKLRAESRSKSVKSAQEVKEGLSRLMDKAEQKGDFTGYTQLANRLAKMEGFDEPEKHEMQVNDLRQIVARARAKNAQ